MNWKKKLVGERVNSTGGLQKKNNNKKTDTRNYICFLYKSIFPGIVLFDPLFFNQQNVIICSFSHYQHFLKV